MVRNGINDSGSGSDSESKGSRSPSPNQSDDEASQGDQRSRHSSRSKSRSKSNSRTPSRSPSKSRSQTPASRTSRSRSHSRTPSNASHKSRSRSRSASRKSGSRSRSGSQKSGSRSRSGSRKSGSRSRSGSRKSGSRSRSGSRKSGSRSRSGSQHSNRSRSPSGSRHSKSRSRSVSPHQSQKSKSRSRSASQHSNSGSEIGGEKRKRQILSDSGSETEKTQPKKKKSALIDSDSEPEEPIADQPEEDVDATELFGDADDISSDEELRNQKGKSPASSIDDVRRGSDNEDDVRRRDSDRRSSGSEDGRRMSDDERDERREKEKEPEPETVIERRIDVEIPRIVSDLGKEIHFVKLPNFLSVETRPFDPETYEDEIDEEETLDEEGRQRIKLKVSNTIRWREYLDDCGNQIKESNARLVKWSDGSTSLHLGNEVFDVYRQPLQGDHNHMFIRQGTGLQGQAVFRTKLTFRPHSTESFTHKKMTMSLADRSQKTAGIKILTQVGYDPDANRYQKLKKEEENLRAAMRQKTTQNKPKRNRDAAASLGAGYQEHESDDEGAISIAAIKNKYTAKGGANTSKQGAAIYSSDEDESDFETRRNKKSDKTKVLRALADSDDESGGSNTNAGSGADSGSNDNDSKSGSESD